MALSDYLVQIRSICPKLTDEETDLFGKGLKIQTLVPDDIFLRAGDIPQAVAYVSKGLLKAVYTNFEGSRVNVNFFREGTGVCDYQAFRERSGSRYDFVAIEPCILILLPFTHFEHCCNQMPQLERYYRIALERALFAYIRRTERFLITDAKTRYLDFIHAEPELFKRLSVSDLCSYLGISRQTLTKIRKQLLTEGR